MENPERLLLLRGFFHYLQLEIEKEVGKENLTAYLAKMPAYKLLDRFVDWLYETKTLGPLRD